MVRGNSIQRDVSEKSHYNIILENNRSEASRIIKKTDEGYELNKDLLGGVPSLRRYSKTLVDFWDSLDADNRVEFSNFLVTYFTGMGTGSVAFRTLEEIINDYKKEYGNTFDAENFMLVAFNKNGSLRKAASKSSKFSVKSAYSIASNYLNSSPISRVSFHYPYGKISELSSNFSSYVEDILKSKGANAGNASFCSLGAYYVSRKGEVRASSKKEKAFPPTWGLLSRASEFGYVLTFPNSNLFDNKNLNELRKTLDEIPEDSVIFLHLPTSSYRKRAESYLDKYGERLPASIKKEPPTHLIIKKNGKFYHAIGKKIYEIDNVDQLLVMVMHHRWSIKAIGVPESFYDKEVVTDNSSLNINSVPSYGLDLFGDLGKVIEEVNSSSEDVAIKDASKGIINAEHSRKKQPIPIRAIGKYAAEALKRTALDLSSDSDKNTAFAKMGGTADPSGKLNKFVDEYLHSLGPYQIRIKNILVNFSYDLNFWKSLARRVSDKKLKKSVNDIVLLIKQRNSVSEKSKRKLIENKIQLLQKRALENMFVGNTYEYEYKAINFVVSSYLKKIDIVLSSLSTKTLLPKAIKISRNPAVYFESRSNADKSLSLMYYYHYGKPRYLNLVAQQQLASLALDFGVSIQKVVNLRINGRWTQNWNKVLGRVLDEMVKKKIITIGEAKALANSTSSADRAMKIALIYFKKNKKLPSFYVSVNQLKKLKENGFLLSPYGDSVVFGSGN